MSDRPKTQGGVLNKIKHTFKFGNPNDTTLNKPPYVASLEQNKPRTQEGESSERAKESEQQQEEDTALHQIPPMVYNHLPVNDQTTFVNTSLMNQNNLPVVPNTIPLLQTNIANSTHLSGSLQNNNIPLNQPSSVGNVLYQNLPPNTNNQN